MPGDTEDLLARLNAEEVRYLVVGGVAVVLHGHLRATNDLDLVIQLDQENLLCALRVFKNLGYQPLVPVKLEDFADPENREAWIQEKNMVVFSLWHPAKPTQKIDLFVNEPFDFAATYRRAAMKNLRMTTVPVVSLADLIEMKTVAGRPQDLADIEILRTIQARGQDQE